MTSATIFLFFAIHLACIRAGNSSEKFIKLECKEEYHGVYGQQSLLQCIVKAVENVTILTVTWKRVEADPLLLEYHKDTSNLTPGFTFAEPSWNKDNMNVSLLLTKTKMADKGVYECMVTTDRGDDTATTSLSVTAKYITPTMSSIPETNIKENTDVTIFCNSTGGQQTGLIWWFDQDGYNWTHRAELVAKETDDGLFSLSSKFIVLKASSSYTNYTCKVLNVNGAVEGMASFVIQFAPQVSEMNADNLDSDSNIRWLAPVVVIGSLVIGLLAALLIFKRRSARRDHQPDTRHDGDVEAEGLNSDSPQDQRDSL
ncbi:CD276 antigen homolog isoform X4 [Oncorhynchus clarkii lewisi]|uniref:CD276 antigen homolog isoform X3 n=1 Tax=Oncorhynchus clarkii lewisi TaxID=490388 RepID=UPI0039B84F5A